MATINIGAANADDAFYRYKMPKLVAKIEGRGNGIKTNVVNNVDIAKALERAPEYVLKYFGCELGAQTNYDKATGVSIVNGAHDSKKLSEILEGFIKKFVQCYSCGNPETTIKIKKDFLHLKCKACGFVSDVDPRHKLNTFILKNPPENKMSKEEKKLKKAEEERLRDAEKAASREKKEKKEKKDKDKDKDEKKKDKKKKDEDKAEGEAKEEEEEEESEDESEDDDGVVWMTDTSAEAAKRRAEEQLTAATAAMVTQGNIEAEAEKERKRAEREAQKKAEEEARAKAEAEAAAKAAAEAAAADVDRVRGLLQDADVAALVEAVKGLAVSGGVAGKMRVVYEALLGHLEPGAKLADAVKAGAPMLRAYAKDKPSQLAQLIALEHFLTATAPARAKEAPLALKALYDADLADDDVIAAWAAKPDAAKILGLEAGASAAVRRAAQPFVDWLEEDDDEEEGEDEE
mmetsp:Transcript_23277/g.59488  ORF Transcript_23277/g.59488 Transcript_23277/m.59488 type:complete len:461 (-) Transcript_23277:425-1807(-)